jgi:hypothetical protein
MLEVGTHHNFPLLFCALDDDALDFYTLQICFCFFVSWFLLMFGVFLFVGSCYIDLVMNYNWTCTLQVWFCSWFLLMFGVRLFLAHCINLSTNYNQMCTSQVCFCSPIFCSWFLFMFNVHLFLGARYINLLTNYNRMYALLLWVLFPVYFATWHLFVD